MKVSCVDSPKRVGFATKQATSKNPKLNSYCNFCGGGDSTKVGAAIIGASALVGFMIYLGLAPRAQKAETKHTDKFQSQSKEEKTLKSTSFNKKNKESTINRPSNKHYLESLKKQESFLA